MKKILITCGLIVLAPVTYADFWGIKADVGIWQPDYDGDLGTTKTHLEELGYGSENNTFVHVSVEHFTPFIPNFRVGFTDINSEKNINLEINDTGLTFPLLNDFIIDGESLAALGATSINTKVDLTYIDATAYYEVLDNWVNFDLGLSLRQFNGNVSVSSLGLSENIELDDILPMIFILAEVELPFTGWSLGIEGNFTEFEDYGINDYSVKVRYLFDSVLDVGFEAGYRVLNADIDKGFGADIELAGPFAALAFHF